MQGQWLLLLVFSAPEEPLLTPTLLEWLEKEPPEERFLVEDQLYASMHIHVCVCRGQGMPCEEGEASIGSGWGSSAR